MSNAQSGYGMRVRLFDSAASPPALFELEEVSNVEGPGDETDVIDTTHHQSPGQYDENTPGRSRLTPITVEGACVPGNATDALLKTLRASKAKVLCQIVYPDSPATVFQCTVWVSSYVPSYPLDDKLAFTLMLQPTGIGEFNPTP